MNAIKSVLGPARGQYAGTADNEKSIIVPTKEMENKTQESGSGSAPTESAVIVEEIVDEENVDVLPPSIGQENPFQKNPPASGDDDGYKVNIPKTL